MFELDNIYTDHVAATSSSSLSIGSAQIIDGSSTEYSEYPNCPLALSGNPRPKFINRPEEWYHGRLSKNDSEEILRATNKVGSFLIRDSESQKNTYVLSFMKSPDDVKHFRILKICGEYFAEDKKYESLVQFVDYHSTEAVIYSGLYLTHPVKPDLKTVERSERKVVAVVSFRGMQDSEELSFVKSDIFTVIEELEGNWLWVQSERTNENGLVYEGLVENLSEILSPNNLPYFYNCISVQEASAMLLNAGKGSYLVKPSDSHPQNYTLLFHTGQSVSKVAIKTLKDGFDVGARFYKTLHSIIERYSKTEICSGVILQTPLYKTSFMELPDSNNALDVELYKHLRLDRISCRSGGANVSKTGYIYNKSKLDGKWRHMFFVLKEIEGQLLFYESEKQTKPKSVLDLCHCSYYDVHRSLFDQSYCFQIVLHGINKPVEMFFYTDTEKQFEEWSSVLSPLCVGHRRRYSSPFSCYRKMSDQSKKIRRMYKIHLKVHEAKFENSKNYADIFAVLSINGAKIYRTGYYTPSASHGSNSSGMGCSSAERILINEEIDLENVHNEVSNVMLNFYGRSKRFQRHSDLGCVKIDIALNERSSPNEQHRNEDTFVIHDWLKVKSKDTECGQCRLYLRYQRQKIMPLEEYGSLFEILRVNDFDLCQLLADISTDEDKHRLAFALLHIFSTENSYVDLIMNELQREIRESIEPAVLFRKTSFASILVYELLNLDARNFIKASLKHPVAQISEFKCTLKIDLRKSHRVESKLDSSCNFNNGNSGSNAASSSCATNPPSSVNGNGGDISAYTGILSTEKDHASLLINFTQAICRSLKESVPYFPKSAQHILNRLKIRVVEKWPDDLQISVRAVSSFLFLRLICLALLNPKQYELISEPAHDYTQRNLLLITRVLQKAANVREKRCGLSPDDDDYDLLESINSSFADIKKDVADFIEIASAPCALPKNCAKPCDVATHFATIISLTQKHLGKIKTEPINRVSAFLSVIEMLKNHLNRYMGEISRNTLCGAKPTSNIIL